MFLTEGSPELSRIEKLRSLPLSPRISRRHSCRGPEQHFYSTRLPALARRGIPEPGLKIVFLASWRIRGEERVVPPDPCDVLGRGPFPHRQPRARAGHVVVPAAILADGGPGAHHPPPGPRRPRPPRTRNRGPAHRPAIFAGAAAGVRSSILTVRSARSL